MVCFAGKSEVVEAIGPSLSGPFPIYTMSAFFL